MRQSQRPWHRQMGASRAESCPEPDIFIWGLKDPARMESSEFPVGEAAPRAARYDFAHKSRADRPARVPPVAGSRLEEPPEVLHEPFCTSATRGWARPGFV